MSNAVDLLRIETASPARQPPSGQQIAFYGPLGNVQTGEHASATANMNIYGTDLDAARKLLDYFKALISASTALSKEQQQDVVEITEELSLETRKAKPNRIKLSSLFNGLATPIQALGELKPAYDLLRQVALYIGLHLP